MANQQDFNERTAYTKIFEERFAEFQATDYDPFFLLDIQKKVIPLAIDIAQKHKQQVNTTEYIQFVLRMFLEYAVLRIPEDRTILRELLMERIRDTWEKQRIGLRKEIRKDELKKFEGSLRNILHEALRKTIYELRAYQVLTKDRIDFLSDGTIIGPQDTINRRYDFGIVEDRILRWTEKLNQLAYALYKIEGELGYDEMTAYGIVDKVNKSGKITIGKRKFTSITKYVEQLHARKSGIRMEPFVPEAAAIILELLTESTE